MAKKEEEKILVKNSKAYFNYFLSDFLEVGVELKGTEIKSIRTHGASLSDAYIVFKDNEAYIINMHIAPYDKGNIFNHDPLRTRKLLMHKQEIRKYDAKINEKGFAIIPTKLYLSKGRAKIEIALGKGKKNFDKRAALKEREISRSIDKNMKSNLKDID